MSKRARILAFGTAGLLVLIGVLLGVVLGGLAGQIAALVLVSLGGVTATSLVFLEVGLSEDRERARERMPDGERVADAKPPDARRRGMDRMRGRPRRLGR